MAERLTRVIMQDVEDASLDELHKALTEGEPEDPSEPPGSRL